MRALRVPVTAAAALTLALSAAASAQLGLPSVPTLPVPDPTQVVTTVEGAVPDPLGGVVTQTTGTVGGVLDGATGGVTGTIGQTIDQVLGGTLGTLPDGSIDDLFGAAGLAGPSGANGAPGQPGVTVLPDGTVLVDSRPPVTSVKVLNRMRYVRRTGRLRIRITSDEPSIVALSGSVKPGMARHHGLKHSRKAIKFPRVVLAYRKAGALKVTIQFSRRAQRNLSRSFNARLALKLLAVDVARNQRKRTVSRIVKH
jgi:hypothetical protein